MKVYVKATDVMGNSVSDSLMVRVDSTKPRFVEHTFEKDVDCSGTNILTCSRCVSFAKTSTSVAGQLTYLPCDCCLATRYVKFSKWRTIMYTSRIPSLYC